MVEAHNDYAHKRARIEAVLGPLEDLWHACTACGHRCGVNRFENVRGCCRTNGSKPDQACYASALRHFGEEPMLVGRGGSGTVFFTQCNLRCAFCQNHQISQSAAGHPVDRTTLAEVFLDLQRRGAENVNLVTPTQYIYPILLALDEAYGRGLARPLVYNTNAYESVELLSLLEGIVDLYLPDMKYMDAAAGERYSGAKAYPTVAKKAIREMYRQVGPLTVSGHVAQRGLIVRHLVLPNRLADSYALLLWLKDEGMADVTLALMSQYSPQHRAPEYPELCGTVPAAAYRDLVDYAVDLGFEHVLAQGPDSVDVYVPDFQQDAPFAQEMRPVESDPSSC